MSEDLGQKGGRTLPVNRQTIRDAIVAQAMRAREEREQSEAAEKRRKRAKRDDEIRARKSSEARDRKGNLVRALNESNRRVRTHLKEASRSLAAALRAATETPAPRRSVEGRQQQKTIRDLQNALGAIRRVGTGNFDENDFEVDLDFD